MPGPCGKRQTINPRLEVGFWGILGWSQGALYSAPQTMAQHFAEQPRESCKPQCHRPWSGRPHTSTWGASEMGNSTPSAFLQGQPVFCQDPRKDSIPATSAANFILQCHLLTIRLNHTHHTTLSESLLDLQRQKRTSERLALKSSPVYTQGNRGWRVVYPESHS